MRAVPRFLIPILLSAAAAPLRAEDPQAEIVSVRKVWDAGKHNAFTDLIRYHGAWFLCFREGSAHVSADGSIRILASVDGDAWAPAALIRHSIGDLRDPKFSVHPDGRLELTAAVAMSGVHWNRNDYQTLRWFSQDGIQWSGWEKVGDPNVWLWRVTWAGGRAYAMGYSATEDPFIRLYESADGVTFTPIVDRVLEAGYPNESVLSFLPDGTCQCLLRRDGETSGGLWGVSRPPYTEWEWKDLGRRIGGPDMLRLPDGRLLAAVRLYDGGTRTVLCRVDPDHGTLTEFLRLPSGGDTGYAGMVLEGGLLYVSYYSSHEGKTSIYLAKVRIEGLKAP